MPTRLDEDAFEGPPRPGYAANSSLIAVPHAKRVAEGDRVTLDVLKPRTRRAYNELAAMIVGGATGSDLTVSLGLTLR